MGCVQTQNTQPQVIEAQQPPRQVRTLGGKRHPREPLPPSKRPPDDDPRAWWEDETCQFDQELERELFAQREDKTGNTVRRHERSPKRPGNNHGMFTYESPIKGDQALAVKSWMGAVRQPDFPPPVNKSAPEVDLRLEYVYGYRCFDVRQNIFFTSGTHEIVYMAAALGIVLNTYYNSQRFFGAGAQTRTPSHSDDITALAIHPDRSLVATGEVGKNPKIIIWDTASMRVTREFLQGSDSRAVTSLAFSSDGRYLAAVADDNEHTVRVWDWQTDIKIWDQRGGGDKILGICWSWEGSMKFCTVGIRHICFWDGNQSFSKRKGIFGKGGRICNMTSVQYLPNGNAITGGTNGFLYIWQGNQCIKSVVVHAHNSAIHTLRVIGDEVFSGGADKKLNVLSTDLYMKKSYDMPATPRAVDSYKGQTVVGCRNGGIYLIEARGPRSVMESHCDGEVWGLGVSPSGDNLIATSGDDNQIKVWDTYRRKCVASAVLELRPQAKRRPGEGASTLAASSPNQQSRALAISAHSGHVAVGYNDGHFTVRRSLLEIDVVLHTGQNSKEWIEVMRYSPDGKWLAIGSHDNTIYIYRTDNYRFVSRNSRHHSYIIAIDWSLDSKSLKTTSGDYELLFWTLDPTGEIHHAPDGSSVNKNEQWHTYSTHFGWHVQGIYRGITDYTHVNRVDRSLDGMFFAVGNDWGLVELFNNPNDETSSFKGFRGHSEHVTNVKWGQKYLFSTGGYDQCVMQWQVTNNFIQQNMEQIVLRKFTKPRLAKREDRELIDQYNGMFDKKRDSAHNRQVEMALDEIQGSEPRRQQANRTGSISLIKRAHSRYDRKFQNLMKKTRLPELYLSSCDTETARYVKARAIDKSDIYHRPPSLEQRSLRTSQRRRSSKFSKNPAFLGSDNFSLSPNSMKRVYDTPWKALENRAKNIVQQIRDDDPEVEYIPLKMPSRENTKTELLRRSFEGPREKRQHRNFTISPYIGKLPAKPKTARYKR